MNGFLDKRSGNLYVYQNRYFAREKNQLNYYAKPGDKKPRGNINLFKLSAVTLVESDNSTPPSLNTNNSSSSQTNTPDRSPISSPRNARESVSVSTNMRESMAQRGEASNKAEFMLQVGDRNFILRAPDPQTRLAWLEELVVWVKANGEDDTIGIPKPVLRGMLRAIKYCKDNGTTVEGLFRVPGSKQAVDAICLGILIHGDRYFDADIFPKEYSVLDVGSAIKKMFRDLPENIFTNKLLPAFRTATIPSTVQDMLPLLPPENLNILASLMDLCDELCKNTETTKMTPRNLAISFGPSISESDSLSSTGMGVLFEILINNRADMFKNLPPLDLETQTQFKTVPSTKPQGGKGHGGIRQSILGGKLRKTSGGSGVSSSDDKEDLSDEDPEPSANVNVNLALDSAKSKGIKIPLENLWGSLKSKDDQFVSSVESLLQIAELVVNEALEDNKAIQEDEVELGKDIDLERERNRSRLLAARVVELETMVSMLHNAAAASAALAATSGNKKKN